VRAKHENRLERQLQFLVHPRVLILDELGCLPMSREEASIFFRLFTRRYESASLTITSNKSFVDWGELFGDHALATAILDRLLHHSTTINIKGESYRLKEKRKTGLLAAAETEKGGEVSTELLQAIRPLGYGIAMHRPRGAPIPHSYGVVTRLVSHWLAKKTGERAAPSMKSRARRELAVSFEDDVKAPQ
jgi:hypothetical protein